MAFLARVTWEPLISLASLEKPRNVTLAPFASVADAGSPRARSLALVLLEEPVLAR